MIQLVGEASFEQEFITVGDPGEVFRVEYEPQRDLPRQSALYFDPRRMASLEISLSLATGELAALVYRVTQPQERVGLDGIVALPNMPRGPVVPRIDLSVFQNPPLEDRDNLSVAIGNGGLVLMVGSAWSHDKCLRGDQVATFFWKGVLSRISLFGLSLKDINTLDRCAFQ